MKHDLSCHDERVVEAPYRVYIHRAERNETRAKWVVSLAAVALVALLAAL